VLETGHDKIMVLRSQNVPLDNDEKLAVLHEAAQLFDAKGVRRGLQVLVTEYEIPREGTC